MEKCIIKYLFSAHILFLVNSVIYLKRNIPTTYQKGLNLTVNKICDEYFNGLLNKWKEWKKEDNKFVLFSNSVVCICSKIFWHFIWNMNTWGMYCAVLYLEENICVKWKTDIEKCSCLLKFHDIMSRSNLFYYVAYYNYF